MTLTEEMLNENKNILEDGIALDNDDDDDDDDAIGSIIAEEDDDDGDPDKSSAEGKSESTTASSDEEEEIKFTPEMTRNVFRLRVLVILVLFLAAAGVSLVVYMTTEGSESDEFESSFDGTASKVLDHFQEIVTSRLEGITSLATAATAQDNSISGDTTWPFVTLNSFQERAETTRKQSEALFTSVVPMVTYEQREDWENYTRIDPVGWIADSLEYQEPLDPMSLGVSLPTFPEDVHPGYILQDDWERGIIRDEGYGPYFPIWQTSPLLKGLVNFNLGSVPQWRNEIATSVENNDAVLGRMLTPSPGNALSGGFLTRFFATVLSIRYGENVEYLGDPFSFVFFPIFNFFRGEDKKTVAVLLSAINWRVYFKNLLPENIVGVTMVLTNGCDDPHTFTINGNDVVYDGAGDLHDPRFENLVQHSTLETLENGTQSIGMQDEGGLEEHQHYHLNSKGCPYSLAVYPSQAYYDNHHTAMPIIITFAVACVFVFTAFMFLVYDRLVARRQQILLSKATHTTAILSSIYPKNIRDRLLADAEKRDKNGGKGTEFMAPNHRLKSFLTGDENSQQQMGVQPIADLFPHTTVLFADISGFTSWSSVRDPAQVFILLQTVYEAFDKIAKHRRVFKIETIGDCYVAVTGLPSPQPNHAAIMVRFAQDCQVKMKLLTKELSLKLGPGTDELAMRFGLHSGPVTAGVLRGERSRFQLFGDTVNTAARMESTGLPNRIQVSQKTALILRESGKEHWLKPREDSVVAKGKGVLSTYWVSVKASASTGSSSGRSSSIKVNSEDASSVSENCDEDKIMAGSKKEHKETQQEARLVEWCVEILLQYLNQVCAVNQAKKKSKKSNINDDFVFSKQGTNFDEIVETISLPRFDGNVLSASKHGTVDVDFLVVEQLRVIVKRVAATYQGGNPFHNFHHACHVLMAVHKFLQRIIAPDLDMEQIKKAQNNTEAFASQLHDYTHGLNDPLTQWAVVFSALIHDSDHRGVSNVQLGKEDEEMAERYKNKSIAEQNSLDICWEIFMAPEFKELRQTLFADQDDFDRFRQVCVNVVLATDIFDQEVAQLRKKRWERAFAAEKDGNGTTGEECSPDQTTAGDHNDADLRATIVIEHIIQASDVSHTMQHWHVYRKWNKRLFQELTKAFKEGRMGADPASFWYKGELGFFDNYIIPLAKKLKDCNVFGVSSDECLNYALANRAEWEVKGEEIVAEMIAEMS